MVARRHHYVPRCYLNSFAVEVGKKKNKELSVFDVVERRFFQTAPENVALEKDFNSIDLEGHAPDVFEQAMASVESDIGPALTRIIEARSLDNEEDKTFLLNLIGLLHLRNPRFRELKRSFHERVAKMFLDIALSSKQMWDSQIKRAQDAGFIPKGTETSYETAKASYKEENYKVEVPTEEHIRSEMQTFDHALPLLFERKWVLVRAPQGFPGFVTCDHPVSLTWSEPTRARPGLKLKGTEILFPISPALAVVGVFELVCGVYDCNEEQVASANGTTILNAERQVYARGAFSYQIDQNKPPCPSSELVGDADFGRSRD